MKKMMIAVGLFLLSATYLASPAEAIDTAVVGQPYYGYGYYGGGFYGAPFIGGGYYGGYGAANPAFAAGGGNPYYIMGLQRQAGAVSQSQVRHAIGQSSRIFFAPVQTNPNAFDGPYVDYVDGVYAY